MPDTGPTSERLEALRERWEADSGSRVFLQLADEYRRLGRTEEAARVLEEGLEASPNHLAAQVALGRCHLELGRPEEAATLLEGVIESDPTQMVAYRLLVDAYLRQGRADEARQRLRIYGLLNDSDPEIAELRRRIGELDRSRPEEPEGREAEGAGGATGAETKPEPEDEESTSPFQSSPGEAPASAAAGPNGEPFPGLADPAARRRYLDALAGGELFEGERPSPAPPTEEAPGPAPHGAPGQAGEVFELEGPSGAAAPDLSSLLPAPEARSDRAPEAPPVQPPEAPPPSAGEPAPSPDEPASAPAGSPGVAPDERGRPTLTLGRLYLRQGHLREAEEIFREVLEREPDNAEARRSLEVLRSSGLPAEAPPEAAPTLEASELLRGYPGGAGLTDRKRYVLERYLERLRGRAPRDVH